MFGVMNRETGKCWPSIGLWYKTNLDEFLYKAVNIETVAVPKDYINTRIVKIPESNDFYEGKRINSRS